MFGEPHDIPREFPEYSDVIRHLHDNDSEFQQMYVEYHALDQEIREIEQNIEPVSDTYAEVLKKKRVFLKDQLYAKLRRQSSHAAYS